MHYICAIKYETHMDQYPTAYLLITFSYVIIFGILGATTFFLDIPSDKGMESYKKARRTLGSSLIALSVYCIIRIIFKHHHYDYMDFWLLVTFTLIHSWTTYSSLLFLLESPRYITRRFIIDGAVPASLMLICGTIGMFYSNAQMAMEIAFGCIFGLKCAYMFIICTREYNKCEKDLTNYYDQSPDIKWIKGLMHLSLFMSVATIVSFYVTQIHFLYYLSIPVIYTVIVFKVINFAPRKIDAIRKQNVTLDQPKEEKKVAKGIEEKLYPVVQAWVEKKKFCTTDLNIKDVAADMGTNQNYLSQYLNGVLNTSFQTWLNTLRVEESKALLTDGTKRSIEEIGSMVGFSQTYNFSRWFRTVTGTTPFRFRQGR